MTGRGLTVEPQDREFVFYETSEHCAGYVVLVRDDRRGQANGYTSAWRWFDLTANPARAMSWPDVLSKAAADGGTLRCLYREGGA